jgi:UDP-N-acetylmuramoylalanine--D-glutamate ligase
VPASAVREGLAQFEPAGHRIADAGTVDGVRFVDDSKATNAHAAETSLSGYDPVVWIAGGLAKGQRFDDLVVRAAPRLRGVVLLGADREVFRDALARHAPDVPVVEVERRDTGAMDDVVRAAHGLARPGDTVLLAPGCASWDMFRDYAARGDAFVAAVRALPGTHA